MLKSKLHRNALIDVFHFDDFDEFWNFIAPHGFLREGFIFRGQANSNWSLVPGVFRDENLKKYCSEIDGFSHGLHFEWSFLRDFLSACDNAGLHVPGDSALLRMKYSEANNFSPMEDMLPIMAMAQHHGLPTRLLDWTMNSLVAAYFAASSAVKSQSGNIDNIALWCFDYRKFHKFKNLRKISLPSGYIRNMAQQKGCFITFLPDAENQSTIDCIEDCVDSISKASAIFQIELPAKFCSDLLLRCQLYGFSASSLFPDYYGAVSEVVEMRLAEKKVGKI